MEMRIEHENLIKSTINNNKNLSPKESIKSSFILKKIFSFIYEKRKLNIIAYNKNYQILLGINIENYKISSGKIKINGINGYGKEILLETMETTFKGEYLNRKRNGKGKEHITRNITYKGEYLNGKRNGKGKEYYNYSKKIIFEGEYLNGKRWNGKVKEYYGDYDLKMIGEYKNGEINGSVKEYYENNKLKFEGEYLNGKKWNGILYDKYNYNNYEIKNGNGQIDEYNEDGILVFKGEYINGIKKGKEYDKYGNLLFEGEYIDEVKWKGIIKEYKCINPVVTCGTHRRSEFLMKLYSNRNLPKEINKKLNEKYGSKAKNMILMEI